MALAKLVNWNLLFTFVAIAEKESISQAAEALGRGQPAISAALRNLEDQLGYQLAERSAKSFALTDAGRIVYEEARAVCNSIERISTLLTDANEELTGTVRVSIASHMTSPLIDRSLAEFHRRHPKATFYSTVMKIHEISEGLNSGRICFGIGPFAKQRSDLDYFHIFREHCGFYCGPTHPLFGVADLTLADLENERAITYPSAIFSDDLRSITDMRQEAKFADPFVGVSSNMEELKRMIIAGLGIGPIPVQAAHRETRDGLLWRLPPYENVMPIDVYLVTNPNVRPSRTEHAFIDVIKEIVDATPLALRTYPLPEHLE